MAKEVTKTLKLDKSFCRVVTPEFRVSYPHVFKPQAPKPKDTPKYSITMLFPKSAGLIGVVPGKSGSEQRSLMKAITYAKMIAYGPKENWPEDLEGPIKDGDDPKLQEKPGYKGCYVVKATAGADYKPVVLDRMGNPIENERDLYPGCYARAHIYASAWEYMGKRGIQFILDHVQKLRDGESFGGRQNAEHIFAPLPPLDIDDTGNDTYSEESDDENVAF